MQRLHEDDLVGHVLAQEAREVLSFPAVAETHEVYRVCMGWAAMPAPIRALSRTVSVPAS
jgi:hypothetical protein